MKDVAYWPLGVIERVSQPSVLRPKADIELLPIFETASDIMHTLVDVTETKRRKIKRTKAQRSRHETTERRVSREIDGKGRTVRELLAGRKYSIDYYQREYKWQQKQVSELIDDLTTKFSESHEDGNERSAVADYAHYFLGSIIVSDKDGQKFIIDGQQRLTTLTLLLIFLHHQLKDVEEKGQIADLIFSQKYGKRSFNLDVPERTACMEALYKGEEFSDPNASESIANILARYAEFEDDFPEELLGAALPYFVDWLIENVHLVEITAYSDGDAYTIFETMNDRGLSLTPADMLKGYLLANITDADKRTRASTVWKRAHSALFQRSARTRMLTASSRGLRSQYAESIRERKRGAAPEISISSAPSSTAGCVTMKTISGL